MRHVLCIDLKSFFASCECVERGLDPFTTPLVVANKKQGNGAITLAVSPFLKSQGVPGRTRLYQIPKEISYQIVPPRMKLYIQKSKEVISIYLDFIDIVDLHIYSIDECFLDVTSYLKYYHKSDIELAQEILKAIEEKTGLTATCGISHNPLLAKLAMDLEAKKYKNGIAKWTEKDIQEKLWKVHPLSKVWGIGTRLEKRLQNLGIDTMKDLALANENVLIQKFGVIGKELWEHANGIDRTIISELSHEAKEKSLGHSQVLMKNYYNEDALLIIREMVEVLTRRLRTLKEETARIGLGISYSKEVGGGFHHCITLPASTDHVSQIYDICQSLFERFYEVSMPIRRISISFSRLSPKLGQQLNLFESFESQEKEDKIYATLDEIQEKYGKNSILKTSALLPNSTARARNQTIGGHHE